MRKDARYNHNLLTINYKLNKIKYLNAKKKQLGPLNLSIKD